LEHAAAGPARGRTPARREGVIEALVDHGLQWDNPQALKSRLIEFQRGAVDPPLANVEIEAFPLPDNPSKGFVVCYTPEGPFKPYRSEQAGQRWFLRAGDSTQVMTPRAVPDDPGDDKLVAAALAAGAVLVTNDAHLLVLAGHAGLEVVRPAEVRAD
jgi:hypothetical protein